MVNFQSIKLVFRSFYNHQLIGGVNYWPLGAAQSKVYNFQKVVDFSLGANYE